jgi:Ca2+-binding RTX toxin-like protein
VVTINISSPLFGTGYYTEYHHTEATTLTADEIAAAKIDRFYIELNDYPPSATAILGTGTMTFTDTGSTVANNATMDVNDDYDFANVSSEHLEEVVGDLWGVPGQDMTLHDGTDIDFVWNIRLFGLRFDSYQGISDGSAIMGYVVQVIENDTSPIRYFFFPTADQDLSNMVLPAPGEPVPSNVSKLTHQDAFDGNPSSPFGPNWDYDEISGGTYISYIDLMAAPGSGTDYIVEGTSGGDLIDATYTGDPTGDKVDNNDGNPTSPGVGDDDSIVAGAGDDTVLSGLGNDTVDGGTGNDQIYGGAGNDSLLGGDGSDTIFGGLGADIVSGGAGDDDIYIGAGDTVSGGTGDDEFLIDTTHIAGAAISVDGGSDATDGRPRRHREQQPR